MSRLHGVPLFAALALLPFLDGCSESECTRDRDCASRGPDIVCVEERCVQAPGTDAGAPDAGVADAGAEDAGQTDAGPDGGPTDAGGGQPVPGATLRITEINPSPQQDLIELVAVTGGTLKGLSLRELTNSGFSFTFPSGVLVKAGDVLVLHVGGDCTDAPGGPATCGQTAPFSAQAWDFSMPGELSYSGKVFELLAADGTPVDGVPFVKASGVMPAETVAAVQQLQADRVWNPAPCIHDPQSAFAKDLYCRNIAVNWSDLGADSSVMRIGGTTPLAVPGMAAQWSGPLPSRWGTY
ncbi:hypothetical protein D7V97_16825 [Corallococcus sp. CA053C]|uniref:hypothetical protein n=1 Tax=Corallococcus sp. CA053C TaxID=2316732 RepID=UPI000EA03ED3|nr:hypothetical protein [Corallococcus sp. CA053C]RKH09346.1 hypothetical protein D7V97_16825 [Corallococcus sp. CA053C]